MPVFDVELAPKDLQDLSSADAVVGLFAKLGYDTSSRTNQTIANLAIPEAVARPIKRIELIADHQKLLQVYLFELKSVTVAEIKGLARVFRNFAGQFLLVLTADYEFVEFVLLDREFSDQKGATSISTAQPLLVQHRFSLERRHPTPVHLRVLRRFTWTEADPFGQFDKLRFAYDLAHWSEVYFNNRGLFSDYYLTERLRPKASGDVEFPEWREDPKPAYQGLREIYDRASELFSGKKTSELVELLYRPLLKQLGFKTSPASSGESGLYLRLEDPVAQTLLGICLPFPWGRELDRKDDTHDTETPEVTPAFAVVDLLAKEKAPWVILTNGKLWRLYSQRAHSRATNYYEVDLDEVLGRQGFQQDIQDAFRYFWLLFRMQAFRPAEVQWQGNLQMLSMLDRLLLGSEDYAKQLGENLKHRVFTRAFPVLAEGFIANMRQRSTRSIELNEESLATIFRGTLTLLYRLLFLLYAESRELLPVHAREYREGSLQRLKNSIKEEAGTIVDEAEKHINKHYDAESCGLWHQLKTLFHVIDQGSEELNVPRYNGGLFLADRDKDDHSPEAEASRFLERERIADRYLARAIDLLARGVDPKQHDLVFVDYKSLGVRQLGSIYEGLLEFRLRISSEKLAVVKEKGREVYKPFTDLGEREKTKAEGQNAFVLRGHAYLENEKRERRATGSYYTPDYVVKYIVRHAVGPVLRERFEALRPKLREAQRERREFLKQREEFTKRGLRPKPIEQADEIGKGLVDELFNIKVLDPAMGSGHFLVEAVDFITDKTLEFLNAFPWNPILVHLEQMRKTIQEQMDEQNIDIDANRLTDVNLLKRHVLKRCIYGVDLNPMAVELAKVSLWLDCFTLGAPLSFLDHHLRWGNSLIGSTIGDVDSIREAKGQIALTGTSDWAGLTQAVKTMIEVGGMPDITADQVAESKRRYMAALSGVESFKRVLDLHTARYYANEEPMKGKGKRNKSEIFDEMLRSGELFEWAHGRVPTPLSGTREVGATKQLLDGVMAIALNKKFFHWELEFPEVFYGARRSVESLVGPLDHAGFDAVVGNPPYHRERDFKAGFEDVRRSPLGLRFYEGKMDLWHLFMQQGLDQTAEGCRLAFITNAYWTQGEGASKLIDRVINHTWFEEYVDFGDHIIFEDVSGRHCVIALQRGSQRGPHTTWTIKLDLVNSPAVSDTLNVDESTCFTKLEVQSQFDLLTPGGKLAFSSGSGEEAIRRIEANSEMLRTIASVAQGVVENPPSISQRMIDRFERDDPVEFRRWDSKYHYAAGQPVFVIPESLRRSVAKNKREEALLCPYFAPASIGRYQSGREPDDWLLYLSSETVTELVGLPNVEAHLLPFRPFMERRRETANGSNEWFHLHWPRKRSLFENPKVVIPQMCERPTCCYIQHAYFVGMSANLILSARGGHDLRFISTLINSCLMRYVTVEAGRAKKRGAQIDLTVAAIEQLPVPRIVFNTPRQQRLQVTKEVMVGFRTEVAKVVTEVNPQELSTTLLDLFDNDRNLRIPSDVAHDVLCALEEAIHGFRMSSEPRARIMFDLTDRLIDELVCSLYGVRSTEVGGCQ